MTFTRFVLVVNLLTPALILGEERSPIAFSLQGGVGSAFSPTDFSDDFKEAGLFGARVGYTLSDRWSAGGQFSNYQMDPQSPDLRGTTLLPITGWVQRDFPWTRLWTPYLLGSAGVSRNKRGTADNVQTDTNWVVGLGAGMKLRLSDLNDISFELGAHHFAKATTDGRGLGMADAAVFLHFYLPESWVPIKSPVDISDAELEGPLLVDDNELEIDQGLLAQGELARLQQDIAVGKFPAIQFDPGTAILQTTSFEALDTLGAILRRYPDVEVRIYGFVEKSYTGAAGPILALARSEVVRTYVVRNFNLNASRLFPLGEKPLPPPEQGEPPPYPSRRIDFEALPLKP